MNVGSLFSGIGGFDYGLERAGMRVAWQCEADDFCRRVLARHWPGVPCYPDVRELRAADVEPVDVLCGGFPCQDISLAGKGAGIDGARSGLWAEYARLVGELRPRYVIVENVSALLGRGLGRVVGDLAALGYDTEWDCVPASAVGAPHRRDRLWLVAYPGGEQHEGESHANGWQAAQGLPEAAPELAADADGGRRESGQPDIQARQPDAQGCGAGHRAVPDADARRREAGAQLDREPQEDPAHRDPRRGHPDGLRDEVADAHGKRLQAEPLLGRDEEGIAASGDESGELQDADERALLPWRVGGRAAQAGGSEWWAVEPPVGRVAHGVPDRLDQLAALGNALVPQIAEWLGNRILEWEGGVT